MSEGTDEEDKKPTKKAPQRRPLYLLIPATWRSTVFDGESDVSGGRVVIDAMYRDGAEPETWHVVKCASKMDVQTALRDRKLDPTVPEILQHVKLLRADIIDANVSSQVLIKF